MISLPNEGEGLVASMGGEGEEAETVEVKFWTTSPEDGLSDEGASEGKEEAEGDWEYGTVAGKVLLK